MAGFSAKISPAGLILGGTDFGVTGFTAGWLAGRRNAGGFQNF